MRVKLWPADTIARRFTITIVSAILVAVALTGIVIEFAGVWARVPLRETGLLERADDIVRMIDAASVGERQPLADSVSNTTFRVDWYSNTSAVAVVLNAAANIRTVRDFPGFEFHGKQRRIVAFNQQHKAPPTALPYIDQAAHPNAYFGSVELADGSWVVFTVPTRFWGLKEPGRLGIGLALLILSIIVVSAAATYQLSRPIRDFTEALRRFGTNPRASPIPETGPLEPRASISAFNAMQSQIQRFVEERTAMLAAISHDLRTPLTKMRLRGELVEDEEQRARSSAMSTICKPWLTRRSRSSGTIFRARRRRRSTSPKCSARLPTTTTTRALKSPTTAQSMSSSAGGRSP
jgi:signal transduction histidine kinase